MYSYRLFNIIFCDFLCEFLLTNELVTNDCDEPENTLIQKKNSFPDY